MVNQTATDILVAHNTVAIPALVILFVTTLFFFLIIGLLFVKRSRGRYMLIWIFSSLLSGAVLLGLILLPDITQEITNFILDN